MNSKENDTTLKLSRKSNLELFRIISMILIVAHHYVVNSGLIGESLDPCSLDGNNVFFYLLGAFGKTGINCFVLITGYFMCKSNISLHKFLKLTLEVIFYNICIGVIFMLSGYTEVSLKSILMFFLPINAISNNYFVSCYLVFFLLIPFLNILIHHLTRIQHILLLSICLFTYTVLPLFFALVDFNYVSWFCVLYLLSSFLRLYPLRIDKDTVLWLILTFIFVILGVSSVVVVLFANTYLGYDVFPYFFMKDSNLLLPLLIGVSSFMFFKNVNIKNSKVINIVAATSFGVLLIHANSDAMRQWLWKDTIDCMGHFAVPLYWLYAIGCILAVFIVCSLIDFVRITLIEKPCLAFFENLCVSLKQRVENRWKKNN